MRSDSNQNFWRHALGAVRWRRIILGLVLLAVACVVYALSFGQVLRYYHSHVGDGWRELPPLVRTFYAPLRGLGDLLPMCYERYIYSCLIQEPRSAQPSP